MNTMRLTLKDFGTGNWELRGFAGIRMRSIASTRSLSCGWHIVALTDEHRGRSCGCNEKWRDHRRLKGGMSFCVCDGERRRGRGRGRGPKKVGIHLIRLHFVRDAHPRTHPGRLPSQLPPFSAISTATHVRVEEASLMWDGIERSF